MGRRVDRARLWKRGGASLVAALVLCSAGRAQDLDTWRERYEAAETDEQRVVTIEAIAVIAEQTSDPEVRVEALTAMVDATVGDGLVSRATAMDRLKASPHRLLVIDELSDAARRFARELDGRQRKWKKKAGKFDPRPSKKASANGLFTADMAAMGSMLRMPLGTGSLAPIFAELFLDLPTDASVDALVLLSPHMPLAPRSSRMLDALLAFASGPALECSLELLERIEEEHERLEDEVGRCERTRIGRRPKTFKASQEAWEERERERLDALIEIREERLRELDDWLGACGVRWREFAAARKLPDPPAQALPARAWTRWGKEAAKSLPASLEVQAELEPEPEPEAEGDGG